jgi:hypothetical protein
MGEHLSQYKKSLLPLLKCLLKYQLFCCLAIPTITDPNPLALEAKLQVLAELLPTDVSDNYSKLNSAKPTSQHFSWQTWLMLTAPVMVASNERSFSNFKTTRKTYVYSSDH